ncbi:MAG: SusC/RagA family TonB-linked outer membrane protein [Flavisolibacter sp.]
MRKIQLVLLALLIGCFAFSQNHLVTGKIIDEKGDAFPFTTVKVKGTKLATTADENGVFRINVPEAAVLQFSYAGAVSKEVSVGSQSSLTVILTRTNLDLTAVVVTTSLGLKRQARELGYAAATLNNKTLTQAKSINVQQALNGKVSGLAVTTTNSGVFENAKINIRGIRSLTGNNQPMLVVDGSPTPLGYLYSIPPDDIQDVTILKSAASAAIYGPDAVNGVIVVTTKRGTSKKFSVTVNSTVQAARVAYFPKVQNEFGAGAGEIVDAYGNYGYVPYENQLYGPRFDGSTLEIGRVLQDGSVQTGPYSPIHADDRMNFWNTGVTIQNSVSLSNEDFYMSVEDAVIKGLMPDDKNRRTSFRFNGGKKSGNFSMSYGLNYILQNYNVVNEGALPTISPAYNGSIFFQVLQVGSNVPLLSYKDWRNNKFAQYSNFYSDFFTNPYWLIGNLRQEGRADNLLANVDASYQILPWLKANIRANTNLGFSNFENDNAPTIVSDWALANRPPTYYSNRPGSVFNDQSYNARINVDYFLNGTEDFKQFSLKYILGGMTRDDRSNDVAVGGNNLVVPYLYNVSARSGDANVPGYPNNATIQSRLYSAYGNVGVGFRNWAFVEVTGRNDWDSRLLKQNRSFFYPGANASVILSDAIPSLQHSRYVSYIKLRAAYSKSGNVNLGVYALNTTYSQAGGFPYGTIAGYTANNTIPSPDIKPEFVVTKEAGFEMSLLQNRVSLEATYFHQNCNNQVLTVSQSQTTGYPTAIANAASFKNYGVEMDLGLSPVIKMGKGRIDLKLNATYDNNEVLSTLGNLPVVIGGTNQFTQVISGSPSANNIAIVGMPAFAFQLTDYIRDSLGRVVVSAGTGNPSVSSQSMIKGRSLPLWVIGITPSYSLDNFSVSMTWDYKGGYNFYAGIGPDMDFAGISERSASYGRQRFVFPNSVYWDGGKYVPNTNIQVADGNSGFWTGSSSNTGVATNYFASAAAWRLRELNISYTIPPGWIGNGKVIKRLTLSAVGRNLFLIVPKSNQWGDPEFNSATGVNTFGLSSSYQTPPSRFYGGSLTVQF